MSVAAVSESSIMPLAFSGQTPRIWVEFSDLLSSLDVVGNVSRINGPVDVYCWYEGTQGLPQSGARFMKEKNFQPLYERKQDAKLCLYSLKAWNFRKTVTVSQMRPSPLSDAISLINPLAIECINSASFFQFCLQNRNLDTWVGTLFGKHWIQKLSERARKRGMSVDELFEGRLTAFNCIREWDVAQAYSLMQYMEGYYLIQKSVKEGLARGQQRIDIAFVLPNDEGKYYQDFQEDVEKMLQLDFRQDLADVEVHLSFQFFRYEDLESRPYIDRNGPKVEVGEIGPYFDYLSQQRFVQEQPRMPFLRDVIHNLNGWN